MTGHPVLLALIFISLTSAFAQEPANHKALVETEHQPAPQAGLEITVQDQTNARIPGAYIRLRSDRSNSPVDIRGNQIGIAAAPLEPALYEMSVFAPGFKKWTGEMLVSAGGVRAVQLTLVAMYEWYSGPVVDQGKCLLVERFMPDTKIPLVPLEKLELAPRRRRKPPLYPRAQLVGKQPAGRSNRPSTGRER